MPHLDRRQFVAAALAGSALAAVGLGARASSELPRYRVADLGDLGGRIIHAYGLNDDGLATGMATRHDGDQNGVAFLSLGGRMRSMKYKGVSTFGRAVNNHGVVAGHDGYKFFSSDSPAWTWEHGQRRGIVDANGTAPGFAYDINDAGQVATNGFIYDRGTLTRIPRPPGYVWTQANAINQQGDAVGMHNSDTTERGRRAFTWFDGVMTVLDIPEVGEHEASGVNDLRQVCGTMRSRSKTPNLAFVWQEGTLTELGNVAGGHGAIANAINNAGVVVGEVQRTSARQGTLATPCAFVWLEGGMHDMNELLDAGAHGWELLSAADINNRGQIVGQGRYNGVERAFIATPLGT
jgi:probable HAF family extracellular repeat protein